MTVSIAFGFSSGQNMTGEGSPLMNAQLFESENIEESGTSQQTTKTGTRLRNYNVIRVVAIHAGVYIKSGQNPVASEDDGLYIVPNLPEYFNIERGDKVAVILA